MLIVKVAEEQKQQKQQAEQQSQNLLGIAYSSAPSVAHVKVSGNGYKFDFWIWISRHLLTKIIFIRI